MEHVINLSTTPQTITRNVFEVYSNLHVIPGFKQIYANADIWDKFNISDDAYDIISGVETVTQENSTSKAYYTIGGVRNSTPIKGINIINGKKVLMK